MHLSIYLLAFVPNNSLDVVKDKMCRFDTHEMLKQGSFKTLTYFLSKKKKKKKYSHLLKTNVCISVEQELV